MWPGTSGRTRHLQHSGTREGSLLGNGKRVFRKAGNAASYVARLLCKHLRFAPQPRIRQRSIFRHSIHPRCGGAVMKLSGTIRLEGEKDFAVVFLPGGGTLTILPEQLVYAIDNNLH